MYYITCDATSSINTKHTTIKINQQLKHFHTVYLNICVCDGITSVTKLTIA